MPKEDRAARFSDEKVEVDKRGKLTPKRERSVRKCVYGKDYLAWKLTVSLEGDKHSVFTLVCDKDVSIAFVLSEAIREFGDHGDPPPAKPRPTFTHKQRGHTLPPITKWP